MRLLASTVLLLFPAAAPLPRPLQPASPDTHNHLAAAMQRLNQAHAGQTRFTNLDLQHNLVFGDDGRQIASQDKLFEDTWINDRPYKHLLQLNGKPLQGKVLAAEQARLDNAIADHRPLDLAERARETGGHLFTAVVNLDDTLLPTYQPTFQHADTCDGQPCNVYRAEPLHPGQTPVSYELWVTDHDPYLARWTFDLLADTAAMRKSSNGSLEYRVLAGTPLPTHTVVDGYLHVKGHFFRIRTEDTFTQYKRFATSVTIRPGSQVLP